MWHKPVLEVVEYIYLFIVKINGRVAHLRLPCPCSPSLEAYFKS